MARPQRCRRVCREPRYKCFSPNMETCISSVELSVDEYETIRLMDLEKLTHEEAASLMDVSRTTITEIYESAREKIADSLVNGKRILISGGNYKLCDGMGHRCCDSEQKDEKGVNKMRIAVTYENGQIFQHFGHTQEFKIYDIEDGAVVSEKVVSTGEAGHGALAGLLSQGGVDVLICGGIGGGAKNALAEAGIKLYGGVQGMADVAVDAFIKNNLKYDPNAKCDHHDHHGEGHSCGNHEDGHVCGGNCHNH